MVTLPPPLKNSFHAHKAYVEAQQLLAAATTVEQRLHAQELVDTTRRTFYASPRGQNQLRRHLYELEGIPDRTPEQEEDLTTTRLNYQDAVFTRKAQKAQYAAELAKQAGTLKEQFGLALAKSKTGRPTKQEKATAIAYYLSLKHLGELNDELEKHDTYVTEVHATSNNTLTFHTLTENADKKIIEQEQTVLILPPSSTQHLITVKTPHEGGIVVPDDDLLSNILSTHANSRTYSDEEKTVVQNWLTNHYLQHGTTHYGVVDLRTETFHIYPIHTLSENIDIEFTVRKKLGGTWAYTKGNTDELRDDLDNTPFHDASVFISTTRNGTHTYLLPNPSAIYSPNDYHLPHFYLSPTKVTTLTQDLYDERTRKQQPVALNKEDDREETPVSNNAPINVFEVKKRHLTTTGELYASMKTRTKDLTPTSLKGFTQAPVAPEASKTPDTQHDN